MAGKSGIARKDGMVGKDGIAERKEGWPIHKIQGLKAENALMEKMV